MSLIFFEECFSSMSWYFFQSNFSKSRWSKKFAKLKKDSSNLLLDKVEITAQQLWWFFFSWFQLFFFFVKLFFGYLHFSKQNFEVMKGGISGSINEKVKNRWELNHFQEWFLHFYKYLSTSSKIESSEFSDILMVESFYSSSVTSYMV